MELLKKEKSKFYWYDFTVAGKRYRGSTKETNRVRAGSIASIKLAKVIDGADPLPRKSPRLSEFSDRFLRWAREAKLEDQSKKYYKRGWRLLSQTPLPEFRLDQITAEEIDRTRFIGAAANSNCALRTLRRMLHKAEEWKLVRQAAKFKLLKEYGRTLDDEARPSCWLPRTSLSRAASGNPKCDRCLATSSCWCVIPECGTSASSTACVSRTSIGKKSYLCARQQDSRWSAYGADERPRSLYRAQSLRKAAGRLGVRLKAFRVWSSYDDCQTFSQGAQEGGPAEDTGPVLWTPRLRHADSEADRKSGGRDEDHGAQGREDSNAVSTPRDGDRACCTEPDGQDNSLRSVSCAKNFYGTLYGTPEKP